MPDLSLSAIAAQAEKKAYNVAIALLARREHSQKEIIEKLRVKISAYDCDTESVILTVVQRLEDSGYLSNIRFTEAYSRARLAKGFGRERIAMELAEKGIDAFLIEQTLDQFEEEWPDIIESVWRKKYKSLPLEYAEKAKQQNFLRYRGFSFADIDTLFQTLKQSALKIEG